MNNRKEMLECNILLYNKELADLGLDGNALDYWCHFQIDLTQVYASRPYNEQDYPNTTLIYTKSGDSFVIDKEFSKFKEMLKLI